MSEKPGPEEWELDLDNEELPIEAHPEHISLGGVNYKVDIEYGDEEVGPDDDLQMQRTMHIQGIYNADTHEDVPLDSELGLEITALSKAKFNKVNIPKTSEEIENLTRPA